MRRWEDDHVFDDWYLTPPRHGAGWLVLFVLVCAAVGFAVAYGWPA